MAYKNEHKVCINSKGNVVPQKCKVFLVFNKAPLQNYRVKLKVKHHAFFT
jgi:hypothetical protein